VRLVCFGDIHTTFGATDGLPEELAIADLTNFDD